MLLNRKGQGNLWFGADYTINLYRGCHFGCIYCDSRSECYRIEAFDTVRLKETVFTELEQEMRIKRRKGVISIGAMSDSYNRMESSQGATRHLLELADRYGFGIQITTKSASILDDLEILKRIAVHSPVCIAVTITTFDEADRQWIEPYSSSTQERFRALEALKKAGIYAGITMMPLIACLNDSQANLTAIARQGISTGIDFIYPYPGVTMRDRQRDYFMSKIQVHRPDLIKVYRQYGDRYEWLIREPKRRMQELKALLDPQGITMSMPVIIARYKTSRSNRQESLF